MSREKIQAAVDFAGKQVRAMIAQYPDFPKYSPMYTVKGKWRHGGESWTHWCEGFFPGMMWLLYEHSSDPSWRAEAERFSKPLEPRQYDDKVHDLGFIFLSTYLPWFRHSGDKALEQVLVRAGATMASRYHEKARTLPSFLAPNSIFIDIMMNVGIVFHAAGLLKDRKMWNIAMEHCLTTRRYLVRGDGSTSHEGIFDVASGEFLRQTTQQGYRNDSAWSRGQAWALYGFGTAYHYSRDERFLRTAEQCAAFYIAGTPSGVPPWDYDVPNEKERIPDTSAAAAAACGMFRLAKLTGRGAYKQEGLKIVLALIDGYLADKTPGWEGVLRDGVYHIHKGLGVSESVMWGEYFFLEALLAAGFAEGPDTWNT